MTEPWWKGKALDQSTHERINAQHYPGTRQLCTECDQPTGRCEDDSIYVDDVGPLCEECGNLFLDQVREQREAHQVRRQREEWSSQIFVAAVAIAALAKEPPDVAVSIAEEIMDECDRSAEARFPAAPTTDREE